MHFLQILFFCLTVRFSSCNLPSQQTALKYFSFSLLLGQPNHRQAFFQAWCLSSLLYWVHHRSPFQFAMTTRPSTDSSSTWGWLSLTKREPLLWLLLAAKLVSHASKFLASPTTYVFWTILGSFLVFLGMFCVCWRYMCY